jgi:ABC-type glycerol-3-phosphate transport system permease component
MSREQLISILKGAGIAGIAAALTFLSEWAAGQSFGVWTPVVMFGLSIATNLVRKMMEKSPEKIGESAATDDDTKSWPGLSG